MRVKMNWVGGNQAVSQKTVDEHIDHMLKTPPEVGEHQLLKLSDDSLVLIRYGQDGIEVYDTILLRYGRINPHKLKTINEEIDGINPAVSG